MKLFGSLKELVRIFWREDGFEVSLDANSSTTYTADRNLQLPPIDADETLLGTAATQTMTNKTIDGDDNTVQDLPVTAIKTVLGDANKVLLRDASGVPTSALITDDNVDATAGIDATKIGNGDVSNTELSLLNGLTSAPITADSTDTLENKTIDGDDNTVQDLALSSLKTVLGDANKVIRRDASGAVVSDNAVPNSSALLTTDSVSVVTEKDIDGGTASNARRITFPKNTKANLDALTRKEGTVVYATDLQQFLGDNGATLAPFGSGSGGGEINYILNPNADTDLTGYVASGAGITVTRTTTAANLPRAPLHAAAILITPVSGTDYVRYRFTMGDADKSKLLKLQMAVKALSGYESGDLQLQMLTNTASDYSGSYAGLSIANPDIPAGEGVFLTTFASSDADYYELRIARVAGTTAIAINDVTVGPGSLTSVPAIAEVYNSSAAWTWDAEFTPPVPGTSPQYKTVIQRVGNKAVVNLQYSQTGAGSGGSGDYYITDFLPAGLTIDVSQYNLASRQEATIGSGALADGGGANRYVATPFLISANQIGCMLESANTSGVWGDGLASLADSAAIAVGLNFIVPIVEWSDNVFSADSAVEYAFNSDTSDASDTTSFGYGVGGAQFGNFTSARTKRVRFKSPILPTDRIILQVSYDTGVTWTDVAGSGNVDAGTSQNATTYGVGLSAINSTDVDVSFGTYRRADGATFGGAGSAWADIANSPNSVWRVVKSSNPLAIGHDLANEISPGLAPSGVFRIGESAVIALQESSTTPVNPTQDAEAKVYVKDNKLIIQFNDAGTVRYKYLDLTGTGVTWVHTTTAP